MYLDNAATTHLSERVFDVMRPYLFLPTNPSSLHDFGTEARQAVEKARLHVSRYLGVDKSKVFFTSGATEANNMAIFGVARHLKSVGKTHIIAAASEHPSILRCLETLSCRGFSVSYMPLRKNGYGIDANSVRRFLTPETGLVCVMTVNNETGIRNDVGGIAELCSSLGILFLCDMTQACSTSFMDHRVLQASFLTVSSHKIHGPQGAGCLYAADPSVLDPLIYGGGQESGFRSGTENVASIVGFGEAARLATGSRLSDDLKCASSKSWFFDAVSTHLRGMCVQNEDGYVASPRILSVRFDGVDAQTLVIALAKRGIQISAGSACHASSTEPSHVLLDLGLAPEQARSTVRFSFDGSENMDNLLNAAQEVAECVAQLRSI